LTEALRTECRVAVPTGGDAVGDGGGAVVAHGGRQPWGRGWRSSFFNRPAFHRLGRYATAV